MPADSDYTKASPCACYGPDIYGCQNGKGGTESAIGVNSNDEKCGGSGFTCKPPKDRESPSDSTLSEYCYSGGDDKTGCDAGGDNYDEGKYKDSYIWGGGLCAQK
jgi:hypothetical protein